MKKFIALSVSLVAALSVALSAGAQGRASGFGILGGVTVSKAELENFDAKNITLYHAGLTYKIPVGLGFAVQPALLYQVKGTSIGEVKDGTGLKFRSNVGYLELPVQVQWGPDLLAFRPYVLAEPFIGYAVTLDEKYSASLAGVDLSHSVKNFKDSAVQRLEYGFSLGAGIEIANFQISAKWFKNLGKMYDGDNEIDWSEVEESLKQSFKDKSSYNGVMVSLAIFF